jgi:hypothetical protein
MTNPITSKKHESSQDRLITGPTLTFHQSIFGASTTSPTLQGRASKRPLDSEDNTSKPSKARGAFQPLVPLTFQLENPFTLPIGHKYAGAIYIGQLKGSSLHGYGKLIYPSGAIYEGEFQDNYFYGLGTLIFNENKYEGQFTNDLYHGQGTFTYADGRPPLKGEFFFGTFIHEPPKKPMVYQ